MNPEKYKDLLETYPVTKLEKIAKAEFNKSIRLRDLFRDKQDNLTAKCISCGREKIIRCSYDLKDFVAGHYFKADRHKSVEYDRENVNLQCAQLCNRRLSGNEAKYEMGLVTKIGQERFDELKFRANKTKKLTYRDFINIILESKEIIKQRTTELDITF